jgi:hypothetical protein
VKLLLILTLLPAHTPVCKVVAVESCTHRTSAPALPPCCAKCAKKSSNCSASVPAAPKPDRPKKPPGPTNCLSPLCSVPSAIVADTFAAAELDQPSAERLPVSPRLLPPDGFHALLDRPPRA